MWTKITGSHTFLTLSHISSRNGARLCPGQASQTWTSNPKTTQTNYWQVARRMANPNFRRAKGAKKVKIYGRKFKSLGLYGRKFANLGNY